MSTPLELESLETLRTIVSWFGGGTAKASDFTRVMGSVRDTIKHLEAEQSGCPTGTHVSYCTCQPAILGKSTMGLRKKLTSTTTNSYNSTKEI